MEKNSGLSPDCRESSRGRLLGLRKVGRKRTMSPKSERARYCSKPIGFGWEVMNPAGKVRCNKLGNGDCHFTSQGPGLLRYASCRDTELSQDRLVRSTPQRCRGLQLFQACRLCV